VLFRSYTPAPPLDRFIENFWCYQGYSSPHLKERILQDGTFKAVFNLQHDELRIYDGWQPIHYRRYSGAIVSRPSGVPFHMIRDFLAFSGFSPTEYVSRQRAFAEQGLRTKHNHMPLVE
jgi:hypothetical protein